MSRRKFTVPQVAKMLGVAPGKVLGWIHSGELRAVNLASKVSGRPRFAIDVDDLAAFEQSRLVHPDPPARPLRRQAKGVTEYV